MWFYGVVARQPADILVYGLNRLHIISVLEVLADGFCYLWTDPGEYVYFPKVHHTTRMLHVTCCWVIA